MPAELGTSLLTKVDYFNKRRVLEERQKTYFADAAARASRS